MLTRSHTYITDKCFSIQKMIAFHDKSEGKDATRYEAIEGKKIMSHFFRFWPKKTDEKIYPLWWRLGKLTRKTEILDYIHIYVGDKRIHAPLPAITTPHLYVLFPLSFSKAMPLPPPSGRKMLHRIAFLLRLGLKEWKLRTKKEKGRPSGCSGSPARLQRLYNSIVMRASTAALCAPCIVCSWT